MFALVVTTPECLVAIPASRLARCLRPAHLMGADQIVLHNLITCSTATYTALPVVLSRVSKVWVRDEGLLPEA